MKKTQVLQLETMVWSEKEKRMKAPSFQSLLMVKEEELCYNREAKKDHFLVNKKRRDRSVS